jgi:hypothetical protein
MHLAMAVVNLSDTYFGFVVIRVDGERVPISFLLGNNGLAVVTTLRLSLQFRLSKDAMHIDEEVFDAISKNLT